MFFTNTGMRTSTVARVIGRTHDLTLANGLIALDGKFKEDNIQVTVSR